MEELKLFTINIDGADKTLYENAIYLLTLVTPYLTFEIVTENDIDVLKVSAKDTVRYDNSEFIGAALITVRSVIETLVYIEDTAEAQEFEFVTTNEEKKGDE